MKFKRVWQVATNQAQLDDCDTELNALEDEGWTVGSTQADFINGVYNAVTWLYVKDDNETTNELIEKMVKLIGKAKS